MSTETVRVMTFNLLQGGNSHGRSVDDSVRVIRAAGADIVGLQETTGVGRPPPDSAAIIAQKLSWHHVDQGDSTGIISRFKFVGTTPRKWGAKLSLPSGHLFYLFNAHLMHAPYQPYQLLGIPYANAPFLKTEAEAIQAARQARGGQVRRLLAEANTAAAEGVPLLLTGDFNEPSYLDWTHEAHAARLCPLPVQWPSTKAVAAAGFTDSYRTLHPDPVKRHGFTWTPTTQPDDPKDHHDRIDFIFFRGSAVKLKSSQIVGEAHPSADIVVDRYPSDHRAVVTEVELP